MSITKGRSSSVRAVLYKNSKKYERILAFYKHYLLKKYPNKNLGKIFSGLDHKIVAIGPMELCDRLLEDLGIKVNDKYLAALGLHMLIISTHDDVVDEMPTNREKLAALVYSGNIATLEASKLLLELDNPEAAKILLDAINLNHLYQQYVIETLWKRKPNSYAAYRRGINHICIYTSIGLLYALALSNRMDLKETILDFSKNYGLACQLIDDLREQDEDRKNGYWSYPLVEGPPFKKTFRELFKNISLADTVIPVSWVGMRSLVANLQTFAQDLEAVYVK